MSLTYDYYQVVLYALDLISQGQTVTRACDESNISIGTFEQYTKNDKQLSEMRVEAERRGHDALADALINIDNNKHHGHSDPKMAKVVSDNIKWLLSKKDPRRFADRIEVKHEVTMDRAIIEALEKGRNRVAAIPTSLIDGDVIDVTPSSDDDLMQELLS